MAESGLESPTGTPDNEIAEQVYKGIEDEGFEGSAVDTLLHLVRTETGAAPELLGDVLIYLVQKEHPDWAAEVCRYVELVNRLC